MTAPPTQFRLRQSQKLESLGQMAAGIAHELSTPMQSLGDNLAFLKEAFQVVLPLIRHYQAHPAPGPTSAASLKNLELEIPEALAQAIEGVLRANEIVRAVKTLAHPGTSAMVAADLNQIVESALLLARTQIRPVARIERHLGELPPVICQPGLVNQVVLNLILNGVDAIREVNAKTGEQGCLTVRTEYHGGHAHISVTDSGGGVASELADRIFEPFFTTKPVGQGSGQGLAIARTIVEEGHGGTLEFTSTLGAGSTFRVSLPMEPKASPRREHYF
ncbi:MAG: ATP-binding protein [Gemmatimonadota bacterium]